VTEEQKIMQAIRNLREHMDLTQTEFAGQVFKKTLPTQQRYETVKPPIGKYLAVLVKVARDHGRADLAEIFKTAAM
jgi:hypothetical protein